METKLNSAYLYVLVLFVSASFKIWHSSLRKNTNTLKHWRNDKVNERIRKVITILTRKEITYFVTCCRSRTEMSEVEELISSWISAKNDSLKRVTRGFMNSIRNGLPVKDEKKVSISTGKVPECATKFRWKGFQDRNQTTTMILRCCPFLKICKVIGSYILNLPSPSMQTSMSSRPADANLCSARTIIIITIPFWIFHYKTSKVNKT